MKTQKYGLTIVVALMVAVLVTPAVALAGNNLVVTLRGVGTVMDPADNPIPDIDEDGTFCFETELFDTKTDHLIGTGADCLQAIAAYDSNGDPADEFDLALLLNLAQRGQRFLPHLRGIDEFRVMNQTDVEVLHAQSFQADIDAFHNAPG